MLKIISVVVIALSLSLNVIKAEGNGADLNLSVERVNPGSTLYPFKRLSEKILSKLIFSKERKVYFHEDLLEKRLKELNFIVNNNYLSSLEFSSQRFSAEAGILIDVLDNLDNKSIIQTTLQKFSNYNKILANLRDHFPANSSQWLLLQQNIDTLNILSQKFI